jgi:hypothetical protein
VYHADLAECRTFGRFFACSASCSQVNTVCVEYHAELLLFERIAMPIRRLPEGALYNPNKVLDAIIEKLHLKNDAALSRALEVAPPVISKIRHSTLPIGATILLRMHEVSDFSIRELRALMTVSEGPGAPSGA